MNDLISKRKVMEQLEIQIADCSRQLKRDLFVEDLVTISERLDTLKEIYDDIKDMTPLQLVDSADRAEGYTKREIETAAKNNCLTIRLNFAYAEIESLRKQYNEALKAQPKQKWISCDDRLPETDDCYLVYEEIESLKRKYNEELKAKSKSKWINCKYELPQHLKNVIVCTKNGVVIEAYYDEESKEWTITNSESRITNITHWQPLPEPPKGE